jgi:hypothetical protein
LELLDLSRGSNNLKIIFLVIMLIALALATSIAAVTGALTTLLAALTAAVTRSGALNHGAPPLFFDLSLF